MPIITSFAEHLTSLDDELRYCLRKFKQVSRTNGDFCALFFSGHGSPGQVFFGGESLTLQELAEVANEVGEKLFDSHLVHFDACSVVKDSEQAVKDFIKLTGANSFPKHLLIPRDL